MERNTFEIANWIAGIQGCRAGLTSRSRPAANNICRVRKRELRFRGTNNRSTYLQCRAMQLSSPRRPNREYTRDPEETLEAFKARMVRELPVRYEGRELWADRGGPGLGCMAIILNASKDEASIGTSAAD